MPDSTRNSNTLRLIDHAEAHWRQIKKIKVTYRGPLGCVTSVLPDDQQVPHVACAMAAQPTLLGSRSTAHDRYQDALPRTGSPSASPRHRLYRQPCRARSRARTVTQAYPRRTYDVSH